MSIQAYLWVLLGILVSVLLPPLWRYVRLKFPSGTDAEQKALPPQVVSFLKLLMPYAALGLASALTALLVLAFIDKAGIDFRTALLAGYAWDSTLQKLKG